jgi:hypothetical protein
LDAVEIAVEIDLEQGRRAVGWTTRCFRRHTRKTKGREVELPNRVVLGHIIIQAVGQQSRLTAVLALDEPPHPDLP